jgi:hypothetical protein
MSLSLTVGTDSYVTVAEADSYISKSVYGSVWADSPEDQKVQALVTAARTIDRLALAGRKSYWDQTMSFPRILSERLHDNYQDPTEVPQEVKDAQCEEALSRLRRGDDVRFGQLELGMSSLTIDQANETYRDTAGKGLLSQAAKEILNRWIVFSVPVIERY